MHKFIRNLNARSQSSAVYFGPNERIRFRNINMVDALQKKTYFVLYPVSCLILRFIFAISRFTFFTLCSVTLLPCPSCFSFVPAGLCTIFFMLYPGMNSWAIYSSPIFAFLDSLSYYVFTLCLCHFVSLSLCYFVTLRLCYFVTFFMQITLDLFLNVVHFQINHF